MTTRPSITLLAWLAVATISCNKTTGNAEKEPSPWDMATEILQSVSAPVFPSYSLNVVDQGAVAGDGKDDLPAFLEAIAAVADAGGGMVVVPEGEFLLNGSIHLKSNINLHLESGAYVR
ncbi:MAG: glycoside hydrolase family 28 protein, partial [Bacteroidia bacterium]|nr:glycoside hydrolase family 28 protein [Bacteroidia bacterium]